MYDEFNDRSFDLNDDGRIDSAEASFIEDTYYGEDNGSLDSDDGDGLGGGGWYPTDEECKKMKVDIEKIRRDVRAQRSRHMLITIVVFFAIWIFVGNNVLGALVLFGLYILGSMFDFWG